MQAKPRGVEYIGCAKITPNRIIISVAHLKEFDYGNCLVFGKV